MDPSRIHLLVQLAQLLVHSLVHAWFVHPVHVNQKVNRPWWTEWATYPSLAFEGPSEKAGEGDWGERKTKRRARQRRWDGDELCLICMVGWDEFQYFSLSEVIRIYLYPVTRCKTDVFLKLQILAPLNYSCLCVTFASKMYTLHDS